MDKPNRNKNEHGDPDVLWISREAIALTIEDTHEGDGVQYVRHDVRGAAVDVEAIKLDVVNKVVCFDNSSDAMTATAAVSTIVDHMHKAGHLRGGWRDISSAPRDDDTHILVDTPDNGVVMARFIKDENAWWITCKFPTDHYDGQVYPTKWQPIPAPHDTGGDDA